MRLVILAGLACLIFSTAAYALEGCIDGHPVKRSEHVTYGGMRVKHGWVRDHYIPLCLLGPDTPDNVEYQRRDMSFVKDRDEDTACEAYCRSELSLPEARRWLALRWPRDPRAWFRSLF